VTGRTVDAGAGPLPGTIGETVAEVNRRGGKGIAVALDLNDDASIAALFAQVKAEQGRLDILVNNAMAIPPEMTQRIGFWEKPLSNWEIFDTGVRAAFVAAWHAAQIMAPQKSGLIVALSGYVGVTYTYDTIFGLTKTATDRMARDMAVELKPHGVASLSLWQGFTYTERAQENLRTVPGMAAQLNSAAGADRWNLHQRRTGGRLWRDRHRRPHHPVVAGGAGIAAVGAGLTLFIVIRQPG
jgi:NAD(P)-dependent dehydrogenase (short-subunit alcohol dehydrogenase family)